jgi:hypothetical protein
MRLRRLYRWLNLCESKDLAKPVEKARETTVWRVYLVHPVKAATLHQLQNHYDSKERHTKYRELTAMKFK